MTARKPEKKSRKGIGGRPTLYSKAIPDILIKYGIEEGLSYDAFPAYLAEQTGVFVHIDTLYEWERVHPEYSEAKKQFLSCGRIKWERIGRDAATGTLPETFNATAWVFTMKNRFGWRDRVEISDDKPAKPEKEKKDRLKEILKDPVMAAAAVKIGALLHGIDDSEES